MKVRSYLILLVVVAVLPVVIFAGVLTYVSYNQQRENLAHGMIERARAISAALDREFLISIQSLKVLAASAHLDKGQLAEFYGDMKGALAAYSRSWQNITLVDSSGQQLINLRRPFGSPLPRTGNPEAIEQVRQSKEAAIADLSPGPVTGALGIVVHVPVIKDGRVNYVLNAVFYPAPLTELLLQQKLPSGWIATIIDGNQTIVARTRDHEKFFGKPAGSEFAALAKQYLETSWRGTTLDGITVVAALHRSDFTGWTVGVAIPVSLLEAPMKRSLIILTAGGLLLLLTGIGLAFLFGSRISRPIAALAASTTDQPGMSEERFSRIYEIKQTALAIRYAADALKRNEKKFRTAVEAAPHGMMMVDREGKIVMLNAQIEKSFGYAREELIGRSVDVLVPERFRSKNADQMKHYFIHPEPRQLGVGRDLYGVRKNGSEFPVEIGLSTVENPDGLMVLATVVDITERKRAEEALKSRYEELRVLQEISQIILISSDMGTALEKILDKAFSIGPFDLGIIRLFDPNADMVEPKVSRGYQNPENIHRHRKKMRDSVTGKFLLREMQHTEPRVEENVPQCGGLRTLNKEGIQSAVIIPVRAEAEVLGVIQLGTRTPRKFSADEVRLLGAIGDQMGIAIQKARLQEQTRQNLDRIQALHEIDLAIASSLNLRTILDILLEKIDSLFPNCATTVRLLNRQTGDLEATACRNIDEKEWRESTGNIGGGLKRVLFENNAPVAVRDGQTDPRSLAPEFLRKVGLVSYLRAPFVAKGETLGILTFYTRVPREFTKDEIDFFNTLAGQAALAIHNAQLYEQVQRNLDRVRALHDIDVAITSTLDLRKILDVLLEKIAVFFPFAAATTVRLLNRRTGEMESLACRGLDEEVWRSQSRPELGGRALKVVESKEPVVVHNIHTDERTYNREMFRGLVSYLGVPLIVQDDILGTLSLYTREEHEFTKEEIEFFNTLASQAAIAIHNARLFDQVDSSRNELEITNRYLEKSLNELSSLYTALSPLSPSESIGAMMEGVVERLMKVTGADAGLIRIWDNEANIITGQRGFSDYYLKRVGTSPPGGAADWVVRHGEPIIAPDIAAEPRLKGKVQLKLGLLSCAMLPLKINNQVRGIIHLASRTPGYFDVGQEDHLMAIARQMEIALENRELFDDLKASRDDLDRANKVKDEFLSVMSHELRTPLSVVMGYTGLVKDGMLGQVNHQQEDALKKVLGRADEQLNMINDIMQTTQLESRAVNIERFPVSVSDVMEQLRVDYQARLDKPAIEIVWEYPAEPVEIQTDGGKMKQILQNLINNAIKFTDEGTVTVSARVTGVRNQDLGIAAAAESPASNSQFLTPNPRFVEFKVADTGLGIAEDKLPLIFDKFFQVDSSETRLYSGVGLGLYIVKKFADLLGGKVAVQSKRGQGSTFTVTLPIEP